MSSVPLFVLLRVCLLDSTLPVLIMALYIRARFVISLCCFIQCSAHLVYAFREMGGRGGGGGGVMDLVYGSSSSSFMDCSVFFSDE